MRLEERRLIDDDPLSGIGDDLDRRSGEARLYAQAFGREGEAVWMRPVDSLVETDVDAYVERAARIDPDIWVVEVEAADGARFLTETVEE